MAEAMRQLPGDVFIISSRDRMIDQFDSREVKIHLSGCDVFELDPDTGIVTQLAQEHRTLLWTNFSLDPSVASNFYFDIRCDLENMEKIDQFIEQALKNMPIDLPDAEVSAAEIFHNAIKAASKDKQEHSLHVSILSIPEFSILLIGITDDLGRLNLEKIKLGFSDITDDELYADHGRGLSIVAYLMAGLGYNPDNDGYKEIFFFVPIRQGGSNA